MPNDQLKEQYGLSYTGQWKVGSVDGGAENPDCRSPVGLRWYTTRPHWSCTRASRQR